MEMTSSTWFVVSSELCSTKRNEFVLAFPLAQEHALRSESNICQNVIFVSMNEYTRVVKSFWVKKRDNIEESLLV
ncbi:hypothetical protein HNY73_004186 [Argiope bruennichi]|uniref:Uncharacterized protein n=1 Tax=Argiope bruennichi TaxID=94029 RepID=A0A8T0FPV1_ARGBR|nr:hypothetical protein HNY73_004186 [Argiope bruennichi]